MPTFGVITEIQQHGNMASALGQIFRKTVEGSHENDWRDEYEYLPFPVALDIYTQVFWKGEIIVLDEPHGREIGGQGRKPSKWYVTCEHFENVEDAIQRSREVTRDGEVPD